MDMKAAFDSVYREILLVNIRKRGVRKGLVIRCEEVLRKTVSSVRVEEEKRKRFWTGKVGFSVP